jgi:hypothetical protein
MWVGDMQDHNKTTSVRWPLAAVRYSVVLTYCPLMMDNYSVGCLTTQALCHACTRRVETT